MWAAFVPAETAGVPGEPPPRTLSCCVRDGRETYTREDGFEQHS